MQVFKGILFFKATNKTKTHKGLNKTLIRQNKTECKFSKESSSSKLQTRQKQTNHPAAATWVLPEGCVRDRHTSALHTGQCIHTGLLVIRKVPVSHTSLFLLLYLDLLYSYDRTPSRPGMEVSVINLLCGFSSVISCKLQSLPALHFTQELARWASVYNESVLQLAVSKSVQSSHVHVHSFTFTLEPHNSVS